MKKTGSDLWATLKSIVTRYNPSELFRSVFSSPRLSWAYYRRNLTVTQLPARMMIDPINLCNLKCPLCPTGVGVSGARQTRMSYDLFEHIVSLNPNLRMADLYNLGEPFLNKDIFRMFRLCREKGIRTSTHTNLSAFGEEILEQIIQDPPTRLHLSVDGISAETYNIYRVGADFDRVRRNMEWLGSRIKKSKNGPVVEWAFLFHRQNKHEIPGARELAARLGFQFFARPLVVPPVLSREWHDEEDLHGEAMAFQTAVVCPHLWLKMTVKPTGALALCCFSYDDDDDIGSLGDIQTPEALLELWNSGLVRRGRACFRRGGSFRDIDRPILCETCNVYKRTSGLDPEKYPYNLHAHDWMDRVFGNTGGG